MAEPRQLDLFPEPEPPSPKTVSVAKEIPPTTHFVPMSEEEFAREQQLAVEAGVIVRGPRSV